MCHRCHNVSVWVWRLGHQPVYDARGGGKDEGIHYREYRRAEGKLARGLQGSPVGACVAPRGEERRCG